MTPSETTSATLILRAFVISGKSSSSSLSSGSTVPAVALVRQSWLLSAEIFSSRFSGGLAAFAFCVRASIPEPFRNLEDEPRCSSRLLWFAQTGPE